MRSARSGSWSCTECGGRNDREDGPVCQDCGVDNSRPEPEPTTLPAGYVSPVTAEDFLPPGVGVRLDDNDDVPF